MPTGWSRQGSAAPYGGAALAHVAGPKTVRPKAPGLPPSASSRYYSPALRVATLLLLVGLLLLVTVVLHLAVVESAVDRLVSRSAASSTALFSLHLFLSGAAPGPGPPGLSQPQAAGHPPCRGVECAPGPAGRCFLDATFCPAYQRPNRFWYLAPAWSKAQALLGVHGGVPQAYLASFYSFTAGSCYWKAANALYVRVYKAGNDNICGNMDVKVRVAAAKPRPSLYGRTIIRPIIYCLHSQ